KTPPEVVGPHAGEMLPGSVKRELPITSDRLGVFGRTQILVSHDQPVTIEVQLANHASLQMVARAQRAIQYFALAFEFANQIRQFSHLRGGVRKCELVRHGLSFLRERIAVESSSKP